MLSVSLSPKRSKDVESLLENSDLTFLTLSAAPPEIQLCAENRTSSPEGSTALASDCVSKEQNASHL